MIGRIPWIQFRYSTASLHGQGAHSMGGATVVPITLVAVIAGIVASATGAEAVPAIKARPLIIKRVAPEARLAHATRKPDPKPVATTADRSTHTAVRGPLARTETCLADVAVARRPVTWAPSRLPTEQDLLATRPADSGAVIAAVPRPTPTIFVVPRHVSPRYSVNVGYRHGYATLRHRYPVQRSHVLYGFHHGDGGFGYGCHRHDGYRRGYGNFGIGFHFGF